jgi:hypothetical protein
MPTYRQKLEDEIVADIREKLDDIEEEYGPTFTMDYHAFVYAVSSPPTVEEVEAGESFPRVVVGFICSDSRGWMQAGLLRRALRIADS